MKCVAINSGSSPMPGGIMAKTEHSFSYIVETNSGTLRPNKTQISVRSSRY